MLDRYRKKLSQTKYFQRKSLLKFAISLSAAVIAAILIATHLVPRVTPAANSYTTSWIGNSFGGGSKWVQIQISSMYVTPDGTVYTNSPWDESGREAGIYKNGDVMGLADDLHGWERLGGVAVTADKKYIYVSMSQGNSGSPGEDYPSKGTTWHCVRRYNLSGKTAPFPGGRGWDKSMVIVSTKSKVTGLANAGGELYVSDSGANRVRVYDTNTMKELRSFAVANPGHIAVDRKGNLWIIQNASGSSRAKISHYSKQGKLLPEAIADVAKPSAIAVDNQGRLLIADNGPRQQVLIYSITGSKPAQVGTLGTKGGIYAGVPGEVGNVKFSGITGVGADGKGNIYVATDGFNRSGAKLRQFSPSGKLQWQLMGLSFVDNADGDRATDAVDVYTKDEHFVMDYSKPSGKQWTYKGFTINAFKYPQDPRLNTSPDAPFFRRIKGKPYLFLTDMYGGFLQIYRFQKNTDGEVAIPSGMFIGTNEGKQAIEGKWPPNQPKTGEWIWRDRNGNGAFESGEYDISKDHPYIGGWWVDSKGDVWKSLRTQDGVGIRHYPLQGIDNKGNLIYTYKSMEKQQTPSFFTDLRRIEYFPETDTMYLTGFTKENPAINGDYAKLVGSEIARFDNWSKGNRKPRWRVVFPVDKSAPPEVLTPAAIDVASDYVFAVSVKKADVYVYNAKTGALVRTLKPGPEVAGESGWVDIPYGVRAFRRSNGEYLVFVEEDAKAKVIMYRMRG
ncbi:NHL repeat-containing protein [Scytonema sp. NUACC21]